MRKLTELPEMDPASMHRLSELMFGQAENPEVLAAAREVCEGNIILVTGAGGSIGGMICKKLSRLNPDLVVMFDVSEAALYRVHREVGFSRTFIPIIGDIRDVHKLQIVMEAYRPKLILHAAALKHVDMLEVPLNLAEAVSTNILGTDRVCRAAVKAGCPMVMISTDKAVNPRSILGLTKRVAERRVAHWEDRGAQMSVVRFGNVMNSSGSAIPLFRKQIAAGGPVTITDVAMTRYMMTLAQAVDLVLASAYLGTGLFVLDMGAPIKIVDLARMLIRMADLEPIQDIDVMEIGIRPGEKLDEELLFEDEAKEACLKQGMFRLPLPYNPPALRKAMTKLLSMDILAASPQELKAALQAACPEYTP